MAAHVSRPGGTLKKRSDFLRVQAQGRKWRGRLLLVMMAEGLTLSTRLGLTVSRKVGNAVIRNRVKRRLRALWKTELVDKRHARDLVIVALPSAADASFQSLRREFLWLLDKAASRASRAS